MAWNVRLRAGIPVQWTINWKFNYLTQVIKCPKCKSSVNCCFSAFQIFDFKFADVALFARVLKQPALWLRKRRHA